MILNYIKIAFRSLLKNRIYSFINIFGLTIGIVSVVLIMMFVAHEYSYDKFHTGKDSIFKVTLDRKYPTYNTFYSIIPHSYAQVMVEDYPEVLDAVRITNAGNQTFTITVHQENEDVEFDEGGFIQADSNFFDVFSFKLLRGDASKVLTKPNNVVLTESIARKFFGSIDVIGKQLSVGQLEINVSGVCEDTPANSHIKFNVVGSIAGNQFIVNNVNYTSFSVHTYLLLAEGTSASELEDKFPTMVANYAASQIEQNLGTSFEDYIAAGNGYRYYLRPITEIHLDPENIEAKDVLEKLNN